MTFSRNQGKCFPCSWCRCVTQIAKKKCVDRIPKQIHDTYITMQNNTKKSPISKSSSQHSLLAYQSQYFTLEQEPVYPSRRRLFAVFLVIYMLSLSPRHQSLSPSYARTDVSLRVPGQNNKINKVKLSCHALYLFAWYLSCSDTLPYKSISLIFKYVPACRNYIRSFDNVLK